MESAHFYFSVPDTYVCHLYNKITVRFVVTLCCLQDVEIQTLKSNYKVIHTERPTGNGAAKLHAVATLYHS